MRNQISYPFRFSRNPIYLGMAIVLAGVTLLLGSLTSWLIVPVFVWAISHNVIPVDEPMLSELFADQYRQYQNQIRRWI